MDNEVDPPAVHEIQPAKAAIGTMEEVISGMVTAQQLALDADGNELKDLRRNVTVQVAGTAVDAQWSAFLAETATQQDIDDLHQFILDSEASKANMI
jgi:hypothetical protein